MQAVRKRKIDVVPTIPDRLYFKIGDVARICAVETYVLRFWESQFPQLKPNKSGTGQRLYRRRDVETALEIKRLVHTQGYTIAGARQALDQANRPAEPNTRVESQPAPQPLLQVQPVAAPKVLLATPKRETPAEPQSHPQFLPTNPLSRPDAVAAAIHQARLELREIASLLASPVTQQPRRRPRLTALSSTSGSLFPS